MSLSRPRLLLFASVFLLVFILISVELSRAITSSRENADRNTFSELAGMQGSRGLLVLSLRLTPMGFVPREITRPAGNYHFALSNVSGVSEIELRLDREGGQRVREITLNRKKPWRESLRLTPGVYLLSEANHPDWICRITITRAD
jgi:hypothetical protein